MVWADKCITRCIENIRDGTVMFGMVLATVMRRIELWLEFLQLQCRCGVAITLKIEMRKVRI